MWGEKKIFRKRFSCKGGKKKLKKGEGATSPVKIGGSSLSFEKRGKDDPRTRPSHSGGGKVLNPLLRVSLSKGGISSEKKNIYIAAKGGTTSSH